MRFWLRTTGSSGISRIFLMKLAMKYFLMDSLGSKFLASCAVPTCQTSPFSGLAKTTNGWTELLVDRNTIAPTRMRFTASCPMFRRRRLWFWTMTEPSRLSQMSLAFFSAGDLGL